ncbi:MAG: hypothetical protein HY901_35080 [Deltaproteobacteria bacterium]|nr:hypothetical protein [Deltaproteobacteria bacterium]
MDMVNNHIPTFEDKAEALTCFPLFRTWFGLNGLCKLPSDYSGNYEQHADSPYTVSRFRADAERNLRRRSGGV